MCRKTWRGVQKTWSPLVSVASAAVGKGVVATLRHQPRGVQPFAPNVEIAMIAVHHRSIDPPVGKQLHCATPEGIHMRRVALCPIAHQLRRHAQADTQRWRQCARAHPLLLPRSEEHTSELQSLMRNSYAVFRLTKKNN